MAANRALSRFARVALFTLRGAGQHPAQTGQIPNRPTTTQPVVGPFELTSVFGPRILQLDCNECVRALQTPREVIPNKREAYCRSRSGEGQLQPWLGRRMADNAPASEALKP